MKRSYSILFAFGLLSSTTGFADVVPQSEYGSGLSASQALARMAAPEGFAVDLIVAEPGIAQPIAMCFDARGRIWVLEGHTYPLRAPEGQGRDRIVILEDADADGSFESKKIFAEGLNLASGIEVGFGGVWVGAAPYLLFIPDADQDDQPDSEPQVVLDGWGYEDTHETLNSFTWGPDGWLYGCHGVFTHSKVGKPGTPEEDRVRLNGAVWRFHPVSHAFEVFAHGTSNPWGVDFNEKGDFFISACVIPHFFHIVQGGRYIRQAGNHFNPYTFGEIDTIADHKHYAGSIRDHAFWGENKTLRPAAPQSTSELGGGHAHCGLAIYQADVFPQKYRGEAFFHNLHGHRILQEHLEPSGSGYIAQHRPDFVFANDHDFIGVTVMQGPDGALYYSDWVDPQTCHHRDDKIWDRSNGRIYRVRYGDVRVQKIDLRSDSDVVLITRLVNANATVARQAQLVLHERANAGELDLDLANLRFSSLDRTFANNVSVRLRIFWARYVTGLLSNARQRVALKDRSEYIRAWAVKLSEPNGRTLPRYAELAREDASPVVQRYLASKLQTLQLANRWDIAAGLLSHEASKTDHNIPLLVWYGIEPLVEADADRVLRMVRESGWEQLFQFTLRRAIASDTGRSQLLTALGGSDSAGDFGTLGEALLRALAKMPPVARPEGWDAARTRGEALAQDDNAVRKVVNRLGARFGDADYFPVWRDVAKDGGRDATARIEALELLRIGGDAELGNIARAVIDQPALRSEAIRALRLDPGTETASALVPRLASFTREQRNEAINLLASRADMALDLLRAVDSKAVSSSLISPVLLDQFDAFNDDRITALIEKNWVRGGGEVSLDALKDEIQKWRGRLRPAVINRADASKGRQAYQMLCGNCHQLFGEGVALGPDLTGSNRADLGYLLENVLAPSAVVGKDYTITAFTLRDGSIVSGMVQEEAGGFAKVALPGGEIVDVKLSDVAEREGKAVSLMPSGLFEAMPEEMVADLVKYLASPTQVPLPDSN